MPPPKGPPAPSDRFVRTLTNVQVELTLTDQVGKRRAGKEDRVDDRREWQLGQDSLSGNVRPPGDAPFVVDLNVDARPLVSVDGPIQLELTLVTAHPAGPTRTP